MKGTQNIFFWFVVGGYVKGGCVSGLGGRIRRTLLRPWGSLSVYFSGLDAGIDIRLLGLGAGLRVGVGSNDLQRSRHDKLYFCFH